MNCIVCKIATPDHIPFCQNCTPRYGQTVSIGHKSIFVGEIGFSSALWYKLLGQKIIRWWVGTDVLLLHEFPPGRGKLSVVLHRIKSRLLDLIIDLHWIDGYGLLNEFTTVRPRLKVELCLWVGKHGKYEKQAHSGINIGYYKPANGVFSRWKYGIDLIEKIVVLFPQINWVKLDGTLDMAEVYPVLDGVLRPARHDGWPRILSECSISDIPYYWSEDNRPDLDSMVHFVKALIVLKKL